MPIRSPRAIGAALLLSALSAPAAAEIAHLLLDTSGSMRDRMGWIGESLNLIEQRTLDRVLATGRVPGFGLIGFSEDSTELGAGWAADIDATVSSVRITGGTEDGLLAVREFLRSSGLRDGVILLISDEPRSEIEPVDLVSLIDTLRDRGNVVHAVIHGNGPRLGRESPYRLEADGQWRSVDGARLPGDLPGLAGAAASAYARLARASGGGVWLIDAVKEHPRRFGEELADWLLAERLKLMRVRVNVQGVLAPGQAVTLDASDADHVVDGHAVRRWRWDWDGDGRWDDHGPVVARVFRAPGRHPVTVELTDDQPDAVSETVTVTVNISR